MPIVFNAVIIIHSFNCRWTLSKWDMHFFLHIQYMLACTCMHMYVIGLNFEYDASQWIPQVALDCTYEFKHVRSYIIIHWTSFAEFKFKYSLVAVGFYHGITITMFTFDGPQYVDVWTGIHFKCFWWKKIDSEIWLYHPEPNLNPSWNENQKR